MSGEQRAQGANWPVNDSRAPAEAADPPRWLPYGDLMRAIAAICVCIFHVAAYGTGRSDVLSPAECWVFNAVHAATQWCVPMFVMLSGALLLDPSRDEPLGVFYRKRVRRIGVPFLFWCLFYVAYRVVVLGSPASPGMAVRLLLSGMPFYHLHFLYIIVGLYLFTPAFRAAIRNLSRRELGCVTACILGLTVADVWIGDLSGAGAHPNAATRFIPFIGCYFAGYYLRDVAISRTGRRLAWVVFLAAVAGIAVKQATGPSNGQLAQDLFYRFMPPLMNLATEIAVFLIISNSFAQWQRRGLAGAFVAKWLAPATLGIYLVHPAFLYVLRSHGLAGLWPNVWVGIPLTSLILVAASFGVTVAIQLTPYLRRVVD